MARPIEMPTVSQYLFQVDHLDRYTHLFPSETDALAAALDRARAQAVTDQMRTKHRSADIGLDGP